MRVWAGDMLPLSSESGEEEEERERARICLFSATPSASLCVSVSRRLRSRLLRRCPTFPSSTERSGFAALSWGEAEASRVMVAEEAMEMETSEHFPFRQRRRFGESGDGPSRSPQPRHRSTPNPLGPRAIRLGCGLTSQAPFTHRPPIIASPQTMQGSCPSGLLDIVVRCRVEDVLMMYPYERGGKEHRWSQVLLVELGDAPEKPRRRRGRGRGRMEPLTRAEAEAKEIKISLVTGRRRRGRDENQPATCSIACWRILLFWRLWLVRLVRRRRRERRRRCRA